MVPPLLRPDWPTGLPRGVRSPGGKTDHGRLGVPGEGLQVAGRWVSSGSRTRTSGRANRTRTSCSSSSIVGLEERQEAGAPGASSVYGGRGGTNRTFGLGELNTHIDQ